MEFVVSRLVRVCMAPESDELLACPLEPSLGDLKGFSLQHRFPITGNSRGACSFGV